MNPSVGRSRYCSAKFAPYARLSPKSPQKCQTHSPYAVVDMPSTMRAVKTVEMRELDLIHDEPAVVVDKRLRTQTFAAGKMQRGWRSDLPMNDLGERTIGDE